MNRTEPSPPARNGTPDARRLIVGLGNPYYGDDAVGCVAARMVHERVGAAADFTELSASTFGVVEACAGYDEAVIIDAWVDERTAGSAPALAHTATLDQAVRLARRMGMRLPRRIRVFGIRIDPPCAFREGLSPRLAARLPRIADHIAGRAFRA